MIWTWLLTILGFIGKLLAWFMPKNKWVAKREQYRKKVKEIDDELEKVTIQLVQARQEGHHALAAGLDIKRERLLSQRYKCKSEYQYYDRLADRSR